MKLVIEDNAVYEYDEQCLKNKGLVLPHDSGTDDPVISKHTNKPAPVSSDSNAGRKLL